jgi:imidazolonepropionase-like amidohydrolase
VTDLEMPLALVAATVLPMARAAPAGPHTIVVEQGVIRAVGPSGATPPPPGARVLDCTGRYVMPGLADMHGHVSHPASAMLWLAHGITTVRDMWGSPVQLRWREEVRSGALVGPRMIPASPYLDGVARYPGVTALTSARAAAQAARAAVAAGYAALKVYSGLSAAALEAVGQVAAEARIPVVGHCPQGIAFERALTVGLRGFEHLVGLDVGRRRPPQSGADLVERVRGLAEVSWDSVREVGARLAAAGAAVTPTLTVWGRLADRADRHADDPALAHVPAAARDRWARAGIRPPPGRSGPELAAAVRDQAGWYARATRVLAHEGVRVLAGTDAGSIWMVPGFAMADELAALHWCGLDADAALRSATIDAAAGYDQDGRWGEISPGALADLLVLDADPRHDPAKATRPDVVVMGGAVLTRERLDAGLAAHAHDVEAIAALPDEELAPMARSTWFAR